VPPLAIPHRELLPPSTNPQSEMAYYMQLPALSEVVPADILHDKRFAQFAPYSASPLVSIDIKSNRNWNPHLAFRRLSKSLLHPHGQATVYHRPAIIPVVAELLRSRHHHHQCTPVYRHKHSRKTTPEATRRTHKAPYGSRRLPDPPPGHTRPSIRNHNRSKVSSGCQRT
jgi:hypothetical protein